MDWNAAIDAYCERIGTGFWAEPVNALSNLGFVLAAGLALWLAARERRLDLPVALLSLNAGAVGAGSFLFHTFAVGWAAVADTAPITLFILGYFTAAMNRFGGFGWGRAALATLAFLAAMAGMAWGLGVVLGDALHGSDGYFPAFFALLGVGLWLDIVRGHRAGVWLMRAALVFAASLAFRTLDGPACGAVPLGTHFLWHLLNGLLLWLLLRTLILHGRVPARLPPARRGAIRAPTARESRP